MAAIPLALVTGFLGSGKTTFLEQTARRYSGHKIVFLINEFSPKDMDGARLRRQVRLRLGHRFRREVRLRLGYVARARPGLDNFFLAAILGSIQTAGADVSSGRPDRRSADASPTDRA